MLDPGWVFVSAALGFVGSAWYALATWRGIARPNLVTWSLWAAAPLIGFSAQIASGVGLPAVLTFVAGFGPLVVVVTALISHHNLIRLRPFDILCAIVAILALVVWFGLDNAPLAVVFAVVADATAALPTIRKAWNNPSSENRLFYILIGVGAAITLLTISTWNPAEWIFAAYMLGLCIIMTSILALRRDEARKDLASSPSVLR